MKMRCIVITAITFLAAQPALPGDEVIMDAEFEKLGEQYIEQFTAFSPVRATDLGDHRFDDQLDEVSDEARTKQTEWIRGLITQLDRIQPGELRRRNQVDYALLKHALDAQLWRLTELREWAWNPLLYTGLTGDSLYGLMARDFAPEQQRLNNAARRLVQFPRLLKQVRATLVPGRVPAVHAETAVAQNRGVLSILDNMVRPRMSSLPDAERKQLDHAIAVAEQAVGEHQKWLESDLLPNAKGNFRIGREQFDRKLSYTLHSPLTREQIRDLGERRVRELHAQMYEIAKGLYRNAYPLTRFPDKPTDEYRRSIIRFGLEKAYANAPAADGIVETAKQSAASATEFIRQKDLITLMPDPLEIIIMPEFRQGVSLAYCDSPGPLEVGQKTFYAVSPVPAKWTEKQTESFLREYNLRSLDVLTIHEAMPGHFLQLAHANRYPGKLRHLFQSGVFVEGWAVYTEWMMCEEGFRDDDPLLKLVTLKWYLRDVTNALLDQAVHVDGISRYDAMQLMVEDAFQEEREAAGKWKRAQLTTAQLSTYFVGYLEQIEMRREAEKAWGDRFNLKTYHDRVLSYGSPPPQFVRALTLDQQIPLRGGEPEPD
jgi:uncharacterized protein (DUF885 family)